MKDIFQSGNLIIDKRKLNNKLIINFIRNKFNKIFLIIDT